MATYLDVDPADLFLPASRAVGADPTKLAQQISKYGSSLVGMPALQVTQGKNGHLRINDGGTRAPRAAKLRPGELIKVEVIHYLPNLNVTRTPRVRDRLP